MTAAPLPEKPAPKTAADLGHKIRYPLKVQRAWGIEWRAGCNCHYWDLLDTAEAEKAIQ